MDVFDQISQIQRTYGFKICADYRSLLVFFKKHGADRSYLSSSGPHLRAFLGEPTNIVPFIPPEVWH